MNDILKTLILHYLHAERPEIVLVDDIRPAIAKEAAAYGTKASAAMVRAILSELETDGIVRTNKAAGQLMARLTAIGVDTPIPALPDQHSAKTTTRLPEPREPEPQSIAKPTPPTPIPAPLEAPKTEEAPAPSPRPAKPRNKPYTPNPTMGYVVRHGKVIVHLDRKAASRCVTFTIEDLRELVNAVDKAEAHAV